MAKRLLASLVLGTMLTYCTAWACTMWSPTEFTFHSYGGKKVMTDADRYSWDFALGYRSRHQIWYENSGVLSGAGPPGTADGFRFAGWPAFAVRSRVSLYQQGHNCSPMQTPKYVNGWTLPPLVLLERGYPTSKLPAWLHAQPERRLPLVPMWPGFVINTFFWGTVSWLTLTGFGSLIRKCRAHKGLCVRCKYNLAGLETCPECGTSTNPRRMAP